MEQGLQGAWVNGKDGRRGLVLHLREEKGDGEKKDNEMRAGQAWRRGKTRAQEFFLEGPWRGLAGRVCSLWRTRGSSPKPQSFACSWAPSQDSTGKQEMKTRASNQPPLLHVAPFLLRECIFPA